MLLHNISHLLHVLSDMNIHFRRPAPRTLYPQFMNAPQQEDAHVRWVLGEI